MGVGESYLCVVWTTEQLILELVYLRGVSYIFCHSLPFISRSSARRRCHLKQVLNDCSALRFYLLFILMHFLIYILVEMHKSQCLIYFVLVSHSVPRCRNVYRGTSVICTCSIFLQTNIAGEYCVHFPFVLLLLLFFLLMYTKSDEGTRYSNLAWANVSMVHHFKISLTCAIKYLLFILIYSILCHFLFAQFRSMRRGLRGAVLFYRIYFYFFLFATFHLSAFAHSTKQEHGTMHFFVCFFFRRLYCNIASVNCE